MKIFFLWIWICLFLSSCIRTKEKEHNIIFLKNDLITVGLKPKAGGQIVSATFNENGSNILKAYDEFQQEKELTPMQFNLSKEYLGHIISIELMDKWWKKGDDTIVKDLESSKPNPNRFWNQSLKVVKKGTDYIVLSSRKKDEREIEYTLEIRLKGNNIEFDLTVTNLGNHTADWAIKHKTRFNGFGLAYIPVHSMDEDIRFITPDAEYISPVSSLFMNGFFTFIPSIPTGEITSHNTKAYIKPSLPIIANFDKGQCLVMNYDEIYEASTNQHHPVIEIDNHLTDQVNQSLLEVEIIERHSNIMPGKSIISKLSWQILPYLNDDKHLKHIEFIQENIRELKQNQ